MRAIFVFLMLLVVVEICLAQEKCCFPDQFEILNGKVVGSIQSKSGSVLIEHTQAAFDYTNKRQGLLVTINDQGKVFQVQHILLRDKGIQYIIREDTKSCQKVPIPANMTHCIPNSATHEGSFYVGDHKMMVDIFAYFNNEGSMVGNHTKTVTRGECLPVTGSFTGLQGNVPTLIFAEFFNYVAGIKDPSKYFTVPSFCPKSFDKGPIMHNTLLNRIFP